MAQRRPNLPPDVALTSITLRGDIYNSQGGHLWFYILRSKISSEIVSTIFTSTVFCSTLILLFRIVSTVFGSADISST